MAKVELKNFNLGGVADSIHMGLPNSVARMVGFDVHTTPGVLKVAQKMKKDTGTTVTEICDHAVVTSGGTQFWFSGESGKIWKRRLNDGVWMLIYTTVPAAGQERCLGAAEYNGYLYWATESRLHRIALANWETEPSWTTVDLNWQTFTDTNQNWHPMKEVNGVLYIGDGRYVHQVDGTTYTAMALDLPNPHKISALGKQGTDLLVGTSKSLTTGAGSSIYRWNTWSISFSAEDEVNEYLIRSFIEADNYILVAAGYQGNLYYWDGNAAQLFTKIPGTYEYAAQNEVRSKSWAIYRGYPIFGVSNIISNPSDQGIWSLGRYSKDYPPVPVLEFPISNTDGNGYPQLQLTVVGAILVVDRVIYASWKYNNTTAGIDVLDVDNKVAKPFLETRVIKPDMSDMRTIQKYVAHYTDLPSSTDIIFQNKINYNTSWSSDLSTTDDTIRKLKYNESASEEGKVFQVRMECRSSGNNAPEIEQIDVYISD